MQKRNCPVICETLNKNFPTISAAAKFAKVNNWTMGMKMEACGQFIDKQGNVYKRLKPMNTINKYTSPSSEMIKTIHKRTVKPVSQETKVETPNPVAVLRKGAIDCINHGDYANASKFITALDIIK